MSYRQTFSLQPLDEGLRLTQAPLLDLLKLWYARRESDGLPSRQSLDMAALKPFLPHIFIAECEAESRRWRWRLVGTAIVESCQRDATGRYFDEIYRGEELHDFRAALEMVRRAGEPRSLRGGARFDGRAGMELEALLLPIRMPAGQNAQVIGAVFFRYAEPRRQSRHLSRHLSCMLGFAA